VECQVQHVGWDLARAQEWVDSLSLDALDVQGRVVAGLAQQEAEARGQALTALTTQSAVFWDALLARPLVQWPGNRTFSSNHVFFGRLRDGIANNAASLDGRPITAAWLEDRGIVSRRTLQRALQRAGLDADFLSTIPLPSATQAA
jgi:hypothetical protein